MTTIRNGYAARVLSAALFVALACSSLAQSSSQYIALRKKFHISQATSVAALETLVGMRTLEIRGLVKGTISSEDSATIYLAASEGDLTIDCATIPDWMRTGNVSARLLIEAERKTETGPLRARLLCAMPEDSAAKQLDPKSKSSKSPVTLKGPISKGSSSSKNPIPAPPSNLSSWSVSAEDAVPYYRAFAKKTNPRLSDAMADKIARAIIGYSLQYGVDARLIVAIIITESDFNPREVSHAGARGLGQLMPVNVRELGISNVYDVEQNLWGTVKLIRGHLDKYHAQTGGDPFQTLVLTLAGYNAGDGAVRKHGGVPPYRETQNYVRRVISRYRALCGQ